MKNNDLNAPRLETTLNSNSVTKQMLNKVPEATNFFWIIKIMKTTVREMATDLLNVNLHLGLTEWSWLWDNGNERSTSVNHLNFCYLFN